MLHLLAFSLASVTVRAVSVAQATSPPASPSPVPIATATPSVIATPHSTNGLILPAVPDVEPGFRTTVTEPPSGGIAGADGPFVGLSLTDAVSMALARNTDLAVSQSNRRIARFQIVAAEGAYDLRFALQPQYTYAQQPSVSAFQSGPNGGALQNITFGSSGSIAALLPSGGNLQLSTSAERVTNNSTVNSYDPYYTTSLALAFTQPLARGSAIDATRRQIELAKINGDLTNDNALLSASNTLASVLSAYYSLVAAWKNVGIQEDALRQAKAQSESNARLVKQGAQAPVDVAESNAQVSQFQDAVFSAIANVASLQSQLKQLVLNDPADPAWTANIVPTSPVTDVAPEPSVTDVVVAALRNRPEVAQLREQFRSADVNIAYAKDQKKPQIDLNVGVTENGFAGRLAPANANPIFSLFGQQVATINQLVALANMNLPPGQTPLLPVSFSFPPPPSYTVGGIGQSYSTLFGGKYPTYTIGATIEFPLRNRTANANYDAAVEQRRQLATQEVGLVQRLQAEARNAVQQYRSARSRLTAARAAREAAETVASSELRKFRAGASTTFLVLQRQVQVANDRGAELQAQTDLQRATVTLEQVTGRILSDNHVDVEALGTAPQGKTPALVP